MSLSSVTDMQISIAMSVLYGLLALTSLSVRLAARRTTSSMLSRQVNAWWRIFPVVSLALLTYPLGLLLLAYLVCLLAVCELAPLDQGSQAVIWSGCLAIIAAVSLVCWHMPAIFPVVLLGVILAQACRFLHSSDIRALIWLLMLITAGAMAMLPAFSRLSLAPEIKLAWLFYLFTITALNDIAQFIAGKLLGRHKIAPIISPNKTWQGLAGGLVATQLASQVIGRYLALGSPLALLLLAVLLSLGGFLGDLLFSAAKRHMAIKDFSQLIPGHGGILDRIDSLVVTAPLLYCLLSISHKDLL
jgi:phosphatidate cytidylyltransferase